jgi:nitrate/TMAO reductase-like tetraheme cytochrome c subunit
MSHKNILSYIVAAGLAVAVILILLGCSSSQTSSESSKGSAQLWSENCGRCHNLRNPTSYSDVQWEVAMHHMRVRADLTAVEQHKILEFLEASN